MLISFPEKFFKCFISDKSTSEVWLLIFICRSSTSFCTDIWVRLQVFLCLVAGIAAWRCMLRFRCILSLLLSSFPNKRQTSCYNLFKKRRKEARFTFAVRKKSFREFEQQCSIEILKGWQPAKSGFL